MLWLTRSCTIIPRGPMYTSPGFPQWISYRTAVHCQNQETDSDTFLLTQAHWLLRFHQLSHAVQEPQFCKAGPPLEGGEENDTNSTKLESRTGDLEGKKREVRCIQITFDPSQLNWFFLVFFTKGKPGTSGPPGSKGEKGDLVVSRVKGGHNQSAPCHFLNDVWTILLH